MCHRDHFFDSREEKEKPQNKGLGVFKNPCKGQQGVRGDANYKTNTAKIKVSERLVIPVDKLIKC